MGMYNERVVEEGSTCSVVMQWKRITAHGKKVSDVHVRVSQGGKVQEVPVQDLLIPAA